jgi:hypothetical protein
MRIAGVLALAATLAALAGCGGGGNPVAAAAKKSAGAGGVHLTTTVTLGFPNGGQGQISGQGAFAGRDGVLSVDMSNLLQNAALPIGSGGGIVARYLTEGGDPVLYLHMPFLDPQLPRGRKWIRLDLNRAGAKLGRDFDQLLGPAGQNPAGVLALLPAAAGVKRVGPDIVEGRKVTQYHGTIDLRKGLRLAGVPDAQIGTLIAGGQAEVPVDVWVGNDDGLVHQVRTTWSSDVDGQTISITTLTRLGEWGAHVPVVAPPTARVYDATPNGSGPGAA